MKRSLLFLFAFASLLIVSCENPECDDTFSVCSPEVESIWLLTEVLLDPGDGSGTFQPVTSDRQLTFFADGAFLSIGSLCNLDVNDAEEITGTINYEDGQLMFLNCFPNMSAEMLLLPFTVTNDELILSFNCDEPCQFKYQRAILD